MSVDTDDFDGPCDVWEEGVHRARKEHRCDACEATIQRGELYGITSSLYDGQWDNTKRCARCHAMYEWLKPQMECGEVCAVALDCGHDYREKFEQEPPLHIQALAFLTPAEAQVLLAKPTRVLIGPVERTPQRVERVLRQLLARKAA